MDKLDRFIKIKRAGEGTYGVVYKAKNKLTGTNVALKKIKLEKFYNKGESEGIPSTAIREISLVRGLKHASVVELLDVMHVTESLYLVFEYLDLDLRKYMDFTKLTLDEELVRSYMKQLMEGMSYLHTHRIIHRDVKPQNLLVDMEGHIKLADFGLSRSFSLPSKTYTQEVVTLWYRAPELLLGSKLYCTGIDIWSMGCVMGEMLTKRALFPGDSEIDQLFKIFRVLGTPTEDTWAGVTIYPDYKTSFPQWKKKNLDEVIKFHSREEKEFLEELLAYDPCNRKTARELLKTRYLKCAKLTAPDMLAFPEDKAENSETED